MKEESKKEVLEAISLLADQMQDMHVDIVGMKGDISSLKSDVACLKTDVTCLKTDMKTVKATMVTKDYLDDKLADFHSDIITFVKRRVPSWVEPMK